MARGVLPIAGCDEAGRGPLAGPVVAAAVILDPKRVPRGLDDSKKLTPEEREALYEKILRDRASRRRLRLHGADRPRQYPAGVAVGAVARSRRATDDTAPGVRRRLRPRRRAGRMRMPFGDRRRRHRGVDRRGLDRRQGDARSADDPARRRASRLRFRAPHGLQRARAFRALARLGPTPHHRRSFAPVAAVLGEIIVMQAHESVAMAPLL